MNNNFTDKIKELLDDINAQEHENIETAAEIIFNAMIHDGILHVFCTGHSHMFAEELFYRAGGLAQVNPILVPFLMQHEGAVRSTKFERLTGVAEIIYSSEKIKPNEPMIIVSNSGINVVPIEMAKCARKHGNKVIVVTSCKSYRDAESRDKSGMKLSDFGDVVIDNHSPNGDGIIETKSGNIGAVSTIACSYIAQSLVLEIVKNYEKHQMSPLIFKSANTAGGDEYNAEILQRYTGRIRSLY